MNKAGSQIMNCTLASVSGRCGLDMLSKWWRGNWWRLSPPAVPFASARGLDC